MGIKNILKMSFYYSCIIPKGNIVIIKMRKKYNGFNILFLTTKDSFNNVIGPLNYTFLENDYQILDVKDKIVVDVGAYNGDSAIYFVSNGAKYVYAFEPFSSNCEAAAINISENHMNDKILVIKSAISKHKENITVNSIKLNPGIGIDSIPDSSKKEKLQVVTLKDIVRRYKIKDAVLKLHCGSENDIILNSSRKTLGFFKQIFIRYGFEIKRYPEVGKLESKLVACGFEVTTKANFTVVPTNKFLNIFRTPTHVIGYIYAKK